jgi:BMFP domain-containing protein YqiC
MMVNPGEIFEDMQKRMADMLAQSPAKDFEKNVKAVMAQGFSKLDLITRDEFDTQAEVLARTRARLQELEAKVAELEARAGNQSRP